MLHPFSSVTSPSSPSSTFAAAAAQAVHLSARSLPSLSSPNLSPSLVKKSISRPTSALNISSPVSNIRRDPTLVNKPDHLPFASAAFAELHRRRFSSAKPAVRPRSPTLITPFEIVTRPTSPTPPPLPPKNESLQFPTGERIWASNFSNASATMPTPFQNFNSEISASWALESPLPPTPVESKRASSGISLLPRTLRSKILKRMTLPIRSSPDQISQTRQVRKSRILRSQQPTTSYVDANSSEDENPSRAPSAGREEDCISPYGNDNVEDADDESEPVIIHYAEKAMFRRPVMVHCSNSLPKLTMNKVLQETAQLPSAEEEPDLWLELGLERDPLDKLIDYPLNDDRSVTDAEAEERLERRLAEDMAKERQQLDDATHDNYDHHDNNDGVFESSIQWREIFYDESIVEQHLERSHDDIETENDHNAEAADAAPKAEIKRLSSAMSELDLLVRDSLLIAHDTTLIRPRDVKNDALGFAGAGASAGRKRKVSFTMSPAPPDPAHKRVASMGPSTPYPFRFGFGEVEDNERQHEHDGEDDEEAGGRGWRSSVEFGLE